MSYDIDLIGPDGVVSVGWHAEGGTYVAGGTEQASLNVTYNYSRVIRMAAGTVAWNVMSQPSPPGDTTLDRILDAHAWTEDSLKALHGQRAGDTLPMLKAVLEVLAYPPDAGPDDRCDYWVDSTRNVAHALHILASWADQHPEATWEVI